MEVLDFSKSALANCIRREQSDMEKPLNFLTGKTIKKSLIYECVCGKAAERAPPPIMTKSYEVIILYCRFGIGLKTTRRNVAVSATSDLFEGKRKIEVQAHSLCT